MRKETRLCNGTEVPVFFVSRQELGPRFGMARRRALLSDSYVMVREDLSPRCQKFVIEHELYHLTDSRKGVFGQELRANLVPGLRDPIGLLSCIWATVSSWERIKLYLDRIRKGY